VAGNEVGQFDHHVLLEHARLFCRQAGNADCVAGSISDDTIVGPKTTGTVGVLAFVRGRPSQESE
jgi:hypothetical protein